VEWAQEIRNRSRIGGINHFEKDIRETPLDDFLGSHSRLLEIPFFYPGHRYEQEKKSALSFIMLQRF